MNEVTKVHLGRQVYTVSIAAHKSLRAYLDAIEKQVHDNDVVEEVELRMAELLTERGISGDKVILPKDVDYLKQQLGSPKDFKDDTEDEEEVVASAEGKRLYRDTENGMIAGVASGVAAYLGLDIVLVRVAFVLITLAWGSGVVVYILLWLLVPEAKTGSDRLRMVGKSVTVDNLKDAVERADVKGAAKRVNGRVASLINSIFRLVLKLAGIGFVLAGLAGLFGLITIETYMTTHHGQLIQENLFPVGTTEHVLANLALSLAGLVTVFMVICGVAVFKRRWPIKGWITGVLTALFFIGLSIAVALTAGVGPKVRERYETNIHTVSVSNISPFNRVDANGIDVSYLSSPDYSVNLHYFGNLDVSKIKTYVKDGTLFVDASALDTSKHCTMLCLFPRNDLTVQVYAPNIKEFNGSPNTEIFFPAGPPALN